MEFRRKTFHIRKKAHKRKETNNVYKLDFSRKTIQNCINNNNNTFKITNDTNNKEIYNFINSKII